MQLTAEEKQVVLNFRKEKEKAQAAAWVPKLDTDYTAEEKIKAFDQLWTLAMNTYREIVESQCEDTDCKQWCFEEVMKLLGPGVFQSLDAQT